jgi:hypothetical protein
MGEQRDMHAERQTAFQNVSDVLRIYKPIKNSDQLIHDNNTFSYILSPYISCTSNLLFQPLDIYEYLRHSLFQILFFWKLSFGRIGSEHDLL